MGPVKWALLKGIVGLKITEQQLASPQYSETGTSQNLTHPTWNRKVLTALSSQSQMGTSQSLIGQGGTEESLVVSACFPQHKDNHLGIICSHSAASVLS